MTGSGGNHDTDDAMTHLPRSGPWSGDLWLAIDYGLTASRFAYFAPGDPEKPLRIDVFDGAMAATVAELKATAKLFRITRMGVVPSAFSDQFLSYASEWLPTLESMPQRTFAPVFTHAQEARIRELIAKQLGEPLLVVASRGRDPEELGRDVAKVMRRALNRPAPEDPAYDAPDGGEVAAGPTAICPASQDWRAEVPRE